MLLPVPDCNDNARLHGLIVRIKHEISFHPLGRKNLSKESLVMFHIIHTFALQSWAFLSQLLVTGDESGFLMYIRKVKLFQD